MTVFYKFYCRAFQQVTKRLLYVLDWTEPKLIKGTGCVTKLAAEVKSNRINSILLVTDKGIRSLGLEQPLLAELDRLGISCTVYDSTQPNPTIDNVEQALSMYIDNNCEGIIAFGGGSPMDCAKITAARVARPDKEVAKMQLPLSIRKKLPPLFAVPTTAGTGSETTIAAVITNPLTHHKYAIMDPVLRPKCAVLDAQLTRGLPKHITSTTGMDALTHAVEAYIGKSNTPETTLDAEKAVRMIFEYLYRAYENGSDMDAREGMLEASYLAGLAFTRAYVGYAHAFAHYLGGTYGVPHGLANAIILPHVLHYYGSSVYKPLARLADIAGLVTAEKTDKEKAELFIRSIEELNKKMNIPEKLDMVKPEDIDAYAVHVLKEANPMYPVPKIMSLDECKELIRKMTV